MAVIYLGLVTLSLLSFGYGGVFIKESLADGIVMGNNVTLTCEADLDISLAWAKNMGPLEMTDRHMVTNSTETETNKLISTLQIIQLTPADEGTYRCVNIDNYFDRGDVYLKIKERKQEEYAQVKIQGPDIVMTDIGDKVVFVCNGGNRQLAWQFHTSKSKQRSLSRAWQLQDNEGRSMITNVDVNNNHMGRYTCYDTAKKHDKSQVILRRRRGSGEKQPEHLSDEISQTVKITNHDEGLIRLSEGSNFSLQCKTSRKTDIMWTRDGRPLSRGLLTVITEAVNLFTGNKVGLYTDLRFTKDDTGLYACVNVDDPEDKDEIMIELQPRKGVMIVEPSGEKFELKVGDGLRLRCTADTSSAQIRWRHNGEPLESSFLNVLFVTSLLGYSMVTKAAVDQKDSGMYECYEPGRNRSSATVNVIVTAIDTANDVGSCPDLDPSSPRVAFSAEASDVQQPPYSSELVLLDKVITNLGCAMELNDTKAYSRFVVLVKGIYVFNMASVSLDTDDGAVPLALYHNSQEVMTSSKFQSASDTARFGQNSAVLALDEGDVVSLKIGGNQKGWFGSLVGYFSSQPSSRISFSGYMLYPTQ